VVSGLVAGGLLWLLGCATAFDGGTIPGGIGGTRATQISGQVVDAANPGFTIPNVQISVTTTPNSRAAASTIQTTTDGNGAFDIPNVTVGTTPTQVQVTLTPADPSFRAQTITFDLPNAQPVDMLIALEPAAVPNIGAKVTLSPPAASVQVGKPLSLKAQVFDAQGNSQKLLPDLLYIGSSGTLSTTGFKADGSDATFNPLTPGAGTITALWNNASSPQTQIQVTPPPSTASAPPSPPSSSNQP